MSIDLPPAQRKMAKGTLFGYRIRKHIGDGAWSRVYEVEDTKTHTAYALKHVVSEGEKQDRYLDQLRAEWEIGSKLDHPAMRKLVALEHQGTWLARNSRDLGLVMELIDAQPLSEQRRPSMPECLQIFRDVAGALMHMHAKGFVHADMKPLNILYTDDRRTKVIDLGQAAKIGTQKVRLQGSPGFIAPEQATETRSPKTEKPPRGGDKAKESKLYEPVTELTDVFNFAATMYWILMRLHAPATQHTPTAKSLILPPERLGPATPIHESYREVPQVLSMLIQDSLERLPTRRKPMSWIASQLDGLIAQMPATAGAHA
jgi:eukaryotic-like serine/threonine-protein kinase